MGRLSIISHCGSQATASLGGSTSLSQGFEWRGGVYQDTQLRDSHCLCRYDHKTTCSSVVGGIGRQPGLWEPGENREPVGLLALLGSFLPPSAEEQPFPVGWDQHLQSQREAGFIELMDDTGWHRLEKVSDSPGMSPSKSRTDPTPPPHTCHPRLLLPFQFCPPRYRAGIWMEFIVCASRSPF